MYGGGAIGGYIAAHLARAGQCDVSVVARGDTLAAIRADGLRVITADDDFTTRVRAVDDPAELGVQDYVFITLKLHQLDAALTGIATLVGPHTAIMPPTAGLPYFFLSGLKGRHAGEQLPRIDPDGRQWATMPPEQVIGCPYWIGVHAPAPAVIDRDGARGRVLLGELDGARSLRVCRLAAVMEAAGIAAPVSENIHGEVWLKFANSLCWNPFAILTLARMGEIADSDGGVAVVEAMMEEADRMGRALGVTVPTVAAERIAATLRGRMHKMSMLQDFERGRPMELEFLYDSLRTLIELTGLSAPTLATVYSLARLRAHTAGTLTGR